MNRIVITDDYKHTVLDVGSKSIKGCSFYYDGRVTPVNNDIFKVFNAFLLSKDNKRLPDEGKYRVMLDNKTGFKHYFVGDQEDFVMFYKNNGAYAISYLFNDDDTDYDDSYEYGEKRFKVGRKIIRAGCGTLLSVILFSSAIAFNTTYLYLRGKMPRVPSLEKTIEFIAFKHVDITADDLIAKIQASTNLDDTEKEVLANRDFLEFILPYANKSKYTQFAFQDKFNNIGIKTFSGSSKFAGYYIPWDPNSLYISEECINSDDKDYFKKVLFHEFAHLCQCDVKYNLLCEALAEQVVEFTDYDIITYPENRYLVSKMMEIVGIDPIVLYVETGDERIITREFGPYLSEAELKVFLNALYYDETISNEEIMRKFKQCDVLLDKIYENKFGISVEEDPVIPYLKDETLVRYYFNKKKANHNGSYITRDKFSVSDVTMRLDIAINKYHISVYVKDKVGNVWGISLADYVNDHREDLWEFYRYSWSDDYVANDVFQKDGVWYVRMHIVTNREKEIIKLPSLEEKFKMLEDIKNSKSFKKNNYDFS